MQYSCIFSEDAKYKIHLTGTISCYGEPFYDGPSGSSTVKNVMDKRANECKDRCEKNTNCMFFFVNSGIDQCKLYQSCDDFETTNDAGITFSKQGLSVYRITIEYIIYNCIHTFNSADDFKTIIQYLKQLIANGRNGAQAIVLRHVGTVQKPKPEGLKQLQLTEVRHVMDHPKLLRTVIKRNAQVSDIFCVKIIMMREIICIFRQK